MFFFEGLFSAFWLWLAFMAVTVFFIVRIAALIYHQRQVERAYRLHLATRMGAALREQRVEAGERR